MENKAHWERIYQTRSTDQVSWYQVHPRLSLECIRNTGVDRSGQVIDIGGGASTLVDHLLEDGFENVPVLDISGTALRFARHRLGPRAARVAWLEGDIARVDLPPRSYDLWHDRAVFHFLTRAGDRRRSVGLRRAVQQLEVVAELAEQNFICCYCRKNR